MPVDAELDEFAVIHNDTLTADRYAVTIEAAGGLNQDAIISMN